MSDDREKAKKKAVEEARKEGARLYDDGITNITSYMNKQFSKSLVYEGDDHIRKALDEGYKTAKDKDKENKAIKKIDERLIKSGNQKIKKKSGGLLKAPPNKGVTKLPKNVRNKMGFMKKGGMVKKCKVGGIAVRGRTKAKHK